MCCFLYGKVPVFCDFGTPLHIACITFWTDNVRLQSPNLSWRDVVAELDYPGFYVSSKKGLMLLMKGLIQGLQDIFPVEYIYKPWKNSEGQVGAVQNIYFMINLAVLNFWDHNFASCILEIKFTCVFMTMSVVCQPLLNDVFCQYTKNIWLLFIKYLDFKKYNNYLLSFQLSFIVQSLRNPDVFCFADYPHHPVVIDILKTAPDDEKREIGTWYDNSSTFSLFVVYWKLALLIADWLF